MLEDLCLPGQRVTPRRISFLAQAPPARNTATWFQQVRCTPLRECANCGGHAPLRPWCHGEREMRIEADTLIGESAQTKRIVTPIPCMVCGNDTNNSASMYEASAVTFCTIRLVRSSDSLLRCALGTREPHVALVLHTGTRAVAQVV